MLITVVRSGGVAGFRREVTVDSRDLPPEQAAHLEGLVLLLVPGTPDAGTPDAGSPRAAGVDRFRYDVTVVRDGDRHTLRTREGGGPPELSRLVGVVWELARRPAPGGPATP